MQTFSLAIHGGAGTILKKHMTADKENLYRAGLKQSLEVGYSILKNGGSAIDAVLAAVTELENNELFNAGKGSVFTNTGTHEMDASIMDGGNLGAGAVGAVRSVKNPIQLAHQVMMHSGHVFLGGEGAIDFARQQGFEMMPDDYFYSDFRYDQWQKVKGSDTFHLDHDTPDDKKFGTVGAVALDASGNLAAATSTGGMTNKKFGRIGDTPVIGSGTYAKNSTCAISCTGNGEVFLRTVAAYDVSALMEYRGMTLNDAMHEVVMNKLKPMDGDGGMIGIDSLGNCSLQFNSAGMYRAYRKSDGTSEIAIF
ncbi:MAG: isoaspartyl peptidase/L-asparaginase [Chitinophagaceae bacterium]|nr:isoaspartyl peptidase/L-asparaginase [Chitinophagaceae bacterium]